MATIERVYEMSRIRRGRQATSPVWYVTTDSGERWRFTRKCDASLFVARGCSCSNHGPVFCRNCNGVPLTRPAQTPEGG